MLVYRGSNYKRPSKSQILSVETSRNEVSHVGDTLFVPNVSGVAKEASGSDNHAISSIPDKNKVLQTNLQCSESMTEEEAECDHLLDGLGPRFIDWWGTELLPVDADLLPQNIPGYKPPLRVLPTGMRLQLTNAEMTNLRKLARKLPCHFALGILLLKIYGCKLYIS